MTMDKRSERECDKGVSVRPRIWLVLVAAAAGLAVAPPHLQKALQAQRELAQLHAADPDVLNDLGNLLMLAGESEEAEDVYLRALELAPDRTSIRYNLALLLQQTGRDRQAVKEYRQILREAPRHAWAHYQLGTINVAAGRRSRAVEHYAKAIAYDPDLSRPEVNAHIVVNDLATDALLTARRSVSPASEAPRLYQQPSRVADLLAPSLERVHEPSAQASQAAPVEPERSRRRIQARWPSPEEDQSDVAESAAQTARESPLPDGDENEPFADDTQEADLEEEDKPRGPSRMLTEDDLVPSQSGQVIGGSSPGRVRRGGGRRAGRRTRPPRTSLPPSMPTTLPTVPSGQPGLPSTGRLDLELMPSDDDMLAALRRPVAKGP